MNYLQPYKGKATRHVCPGCGAKLSFTLYINGDTHEPIHKTVGKCNRESKCGYHYTPKQFFIENPSFLSPPLGGGWVGSHSTSSLTKRQLPSPQGEGSGVRSIPFSFVQNSASYRSNFIRFLCEFMTTDQIQTIGELYALGATKYKEVIFWQIDTAGKVRTGKIMQYNPETGKRIKHESGAIDWVHNKLKQTKQLPDDFNLQQCFFGEHLLKLYPDANVAIVESEKSAIIASVIMPDLIWLAAGNINGLSVEKCHVLKNRKVTLFPDLGAYEKWNEKAQMLNSLSPSQKTIFSCLSPIGESTRRGIEVGEGWGEVWVRCSTLLENISTPEAKANGLDIADYMIVQLHSQPAQKQIDQLTKIEISISPKLQSFIDQNKSLAILINRLELIEI